MRQRERGGNFDAQLQTRLHGKAGQQNTYAAHERLVTQSMGTLHTRPQKERRYIMGQAEHKRPAWTRESSEKE